MTTFIFKLAQDAAPEDIKRVHDELSDRFPHYRFDGSGDGLSDVEFDIIPAQAAGETRHDRPGKLIDPADLDLVKHAFFSTIDGWG